MAEQVYLAVDLGAESGRVIAGRFDGRAVSLDELHRFPNGAVPVADTLRWNFLRLWQEIQIGLQKAAQKYGDRILSVGVDTWGVDYVLFTANSEIIGSPYHYRDARTRGLLNQTLTYVSREEIFRQTGLQFMEINTLYQLLAMKRSHPKLLDMADRFLMIPDALHWLLCGSQVVEFTNATTTQLLHPTRRTWATELINRLELPIKIFPEVVPPGTKLGLLRDDVARRAGLKRIEVIAPATHDTGSAVVAAPTELTGTTRWAYISSGTWSLMGLETPDAVLTPRALELNVTNEGGVDGTYRLLKNIMGLWLVQESKRAWERQGKTFEYAELVRLAEAAKPFIAVIDPDASDFLAPDDMPLAIQKYCQSTGQAVPEGPGEVIRVALEGLALKYRMVLGWLEELTKSSVEVIHVLGGGGQNALLNQFTADACGKPVVAGPVEATALGNILIQARSMGAVNSLAEIRQVVANSSTLKRFEPGERTPWQAALVKLVEVMKRPRD